jgi:adenylyltransferase/sulfurtransferase
MNTSAEPRVLLIGAGGIGAPTALALARAGGLRLLVADDDEVDLSNLHRQILFADEDVGQPKLEALARALHQENSRLSVELHPGRATPATIEALVAGVDLVIDGCDNFPTRFLAADACMLAGVPVIHAASVRWRGTCFVSGPAGQSPCYRCLFEDLPEGPAPDCATAGVMGPVCGVIGALAADAALRWLRGDRSLGGTIASFDGQTGRFRRTPVSPRAACPLCGPSRSITRLDGSRYLGASCEGIADTGSLC